MGEGHPNLILSVGTQVVVTVEVRGALGRPVHPRGAVGLVVQLPGDYWHSYRVKFSDGFEAAFKRGELAVLAEYRREMGVGALAEYDLFGHVIYRCVVGSQAYGLNGEGSDVDRRGVYLPPAEMQWSLAGVPGQIEDRGTDQVYWEAGKFLSMALKANPNILECLYTPMVEEANELAREMLGMREGFLSKMVYRTYGGYVAAQFGKLQADLRTKGEIKWKHAMHLIRLLMAGVTTLKEGRVPVRVEDGVREQLLAIRRGEVAFEEVERWRASLQKEFDEAAGRTRLPDRPDVGRVNELLIKMRRSVT